MTKAQRTQDTDHLVNDAALRAHQELVAKVRANPNKVSFSPLIDCPTCSDGSIHSFLCPTCDGDRIISQAEADML